MLQQNPICVKVNICPSNHNLLPKCNNDSKCNGSAILRYYFVLVLLRLEIKKRLVFYLPGICTPRMIDGVI